jgi:hypothetical protein
VVDERSIPHSHPVLTLHTRHLSSDDQPLSTYVHEQLHWFLESRRTDTSAAIEDLRKEFPKVPVGFREGADSEGFTYEYRIVCYLEGEGMRHLTGPETAAAVMAFWSHDHYTSIYQTVLEKQQTIAAIVARHHLDLAPRILG